MQVWYFTQVIRYDAYMGNVREYGQGPNTDTIGISERLMLPKKCVMNNIFIII